MLIHQLKIIKGGGSSKTNPFVGIEFENEIKEEDVPTELAEDGCVFPKTVAGKWRYHQENSLRYYGFEYVSLPIRVSTAEEEIQNLFDTLRSHFQCKKLAFTNSIRTSVHVHFDVRSLNTLEIINFACLYWLMEPFLQEFCGKHRQGNLFCIRLDDSAFQKDEIAHVLKTGSSILQSSLMADHFRYGSVNFAAIAKFNTLEFRMMRGVSHERPAIRWLKALDNIRKVSLQFKTPLDLKDWFLNKVNAEDVPSLVLGEKLAEKLASYHTDEVPISTKIRKGYLSIQPILNAQDDYSKERMNREKEEEQKLSEYKNMLILDDAPSHSLEAAADIEDSIEPEQDCYLTETEGENIYA